MTAPKFDTCFHCVVYIVGCVPLRVVRTQLDVWILMFECVYAFSCPNVSKWNMPVHWKCTRYYWHSSHIIFCSQEVPVLRFYENIDIMQLAGI